MRDLGKLREEYAAAGLSETAAPDAPWELFAGWLDDAVASGLHEPNAMVVATATPESVPSSRMVLLKGFSPDGFVFFTNYQSRKAVELAANPAVALLFPWHPLQRQVRVEGTSAPLSDAESGAYFATRPRDSQVGAWASPQSRVVASRDVLDAAYDEARERFEGTEVPRPPYWGGYLVTATMVEFWQGRPGRMHDRLRFRRTEGGGWSVDRLAP
jgi:pyridoxamine 5'-phosphate oxidase